MEALVAQIASELTRTPGIFRTLHMEVRLSFSSKASFECLGRMHSVRIAVTNRADPSTTNGR